uniref:Retrovirus-related Pol polyprotein from transposon gypsy n=1 Tax=Bactrocera latifrons TaxID=174628 RepID=A0A0K8VY28_BACLA
MVSLNTIFLEKLVQMVILKMDTYFNHNGKEKLQHLSCNQSNLITIEEDSVPFRIKTQFRYVINFVRVALADPNRVLKFSKFAMVKPIALRSTFDVKDAFLQILLIFNNTKTVVSDNEKAFTSNLIKTLLRDQYSNDQFFIPTPHSESDGQVERFHFTLLEIARCIKEQQQIYETTDLILLATHK